MPGFGHRFYFVGKVPRAFFVLLCLLFANTFLMLSLEFAPKYSVAKAAVSALHWYQDNSIAIQFILLALMAGVVTIFRKRVRWNDQK